MCRGLVIDSVRRLTSEDFRKNHGVGWGSIRDIMVHLVTTERYWISVLKDEETELVNTIDYQDLNRIAELWASTEKQTREYLKGLGDDHLHHVKSVVWPEEAPKTVSFTVRKALIHLATHEIHHRGLIVGMIRKMGHVPPVVDML